MKHKFVIFGLILMMIAAYMWAAELMAGGTAYLVEERIDGSLKQCVYNYLGSEYILTIPAWKTCPVVVSVD